MRVSALAHAMKLDPHMSLFDQPFEPPVLCDALGGWCSAPRLARTARVRTQTQLCLVPMAVAGSSWLTSRVTGAAPALRRGGDRIGLSSAPFGDLPPARVLVPGTGACRLAWEIAGRGHRVEAHDVSVHMLVAARSIMTRDGPPVRLFPGERCAAGARIAACSAGHGAVGARVERGSVFAPSPMSLIFPMHAWSPAGHC
jgi:hypothetical protein